MKFFIAAIAAMMVAVGANAQGEAEELIEQFNTAAELYNGKKYQEAATILERVVRDAAEYEDVEEAQEAIKQAKTLLPNSLFRVGLSNAKASQWEEALKNLDKAIATGEKYGNASAVRNAKTVVGQVYTGMGADAFNAKDYAKAAEIFAKGYEANPTDTKLALNLAMSYCENGDMEKGFKVYEGIIALGETHSKYNDAAETASDRLAYYKTFDISKAIEAKEYAKANQMMDDILKEDPKNSIVNMLMIQTATNQQNWNKIIQRGPAAADAQTDAAKKSDIYFFIGAAYQNTDNKDKAIEFYKKVTAGKNVANAKTQIAALNK